MVTSNDLGSEGHELNHLQGGPESENPEISGGETTRLIRGDFTPCMAFRTGDPGPTLVVCFVFLPQLSSSFTSSTIRTVYVRCRK